MTDLIIKASGEFVVEKEVVEAIAQEHKLNTIEEVIAVLKVSMNIQLDQMLNELPAGLMVRSTNVDIEQGVSNE